MSTAVMSSVDVPSGPRLSARLRDGSVSLAGIALLAALLPARGIWVAGVVSLALCLTLPGLLLLRALRVESRASLAYPPLLLVASLTVLLAAGLGADLLGPQLGVARPLHGDTLALTVIGVCLALWAIGLPAARTHRLDWGAPLRRPSLLLALLLPAIAAVGALVLSLGHTALIARGDQGLVAVVILALLLLAPRLSRGQVAMVLFGCALAAEWAFALRGREVVGFDITTEIEIARHVQRVGVWHSLNRDNAYSAMLSVTVLPAVLRSLAGISQLISFKVLFPMFTATLPVWVYLIGERVMRRGFATGAACLLLVQTYFFQLLPQLARQEVAFLFFVALVAILVEDRLRLRSRLPLIALFSADMVVSHYSTTYLAIPVIVVSLALAWLLARLRITAPVLALGCASLVLVGGAGLWYRTITQSSQNLSSFNSRLQHSGLDLLPNSTGGIINSYINGANISTVTPAQFQRLAIATYRPRAAYIHPLPAAAQSRYDLRSATVAEAPARLPSVSNGLDDLSIAFAEFLLLFAGLGALLLLLRPRGRPRRYSTLGVIGLATAATLLLIRFSGTIAVSYNQTRALAQALLVLAVPAAWFAQSAVDRLRAARWVRRLAPAAVGVLALSFGIMFCLDSTLSYVLTGGGTLLNLSNRGEDYQRMYMTPAELVGATWSVRASDGRLLYADTFGQLRLNASTNTVGLNVVTPQTLDRGAWLYGTHSNVVDGVTRSQIGLKNGLYAWPRPFLATWYDTVFDDGASKVYHR